MFQQPINQPPETYDISDLIILSIPQKLHLIFTNISEFLSYILNIPLSALK